MEHGTICIEKNPRPCFERFRTHRSRHRPKTGVFLRTQADRKAIRWSVQHAEARKTLPLMRQKLVRKPPQTASIPPIRGPLGAPHTADGALECLHLLPRHAHRGREWSRTLATVSNQPVENVPVPHPLPVRLVRFPDGSGPPPSSFLNVTHLKSSPRTRNAPPAEPVRRAPFISAARSRWLPSRRNRSGRQSDRNF